MNEVQSEWRWVQVEEIAGDIVGGGTPAREIPSLWGGGIPWVTPSELTRLPTKYLNATIDTISRSGLANSGARLLPTNALIVTTRATIGLAALTSVPTATNQGFKSIVFSEQADPTYYYHLFKTLKREMERRASGTTFLEISGKEFSQIVVPLPSLSEQQEIAKILDTLDERISGTEQIIAKLDLVRQGLTNDLLTYGIDEQSRLRDPDRNPEQFKESPQGRIPKEWRRLLVGDLLARGMLQEIQDGNHGELHPKRDDFVSNGIAFLMAKDIAGGCINFEKCYRIRPEQYRRLRVGFARPGDVLLSHKGTIGEVAVVPRDEAEVMLTPQVTYYRPSNGLLAEFLSAYMRSGKFQLELRLLAGQSTRDYVGITAQRHLLHILVPSTAEQRRISMIISSADKLIAKENASLAKLQLLKRSLMADLLTGRVRVPVGVAR